MPHGRGESAQMLRQRFERPRTEEGLIRALHRRGVDVGQLFNYSIPDLPAYWDESNPAAPRARRLAQEVVNLPIYPNLSEKGQDRVIGALKEALAENGS